MDEVRFSDWPDPPGNGAWLPAYGFQQQNDLSDKDDFLNPAEAALLAAGLNMSPTTHALYLETIVEETSDDLRSENSSLSHGQGWFSDSDADSVIHVAGRDLDECDSGSERDFMCPPKRRRRNIIQTDCPPFSNPPQVEAFPVFKTTATAEPFQYRNVPDCHLTDSTSDDNDSLTLSRSSSLVQFENIEKSCLLIDVIREGSSPSIYSQLSFDSLEKTPTRENPMQVLSPKMSPDSLDGSYCSDPHSLSSQEDKYTSEIAEFSAKIEGLTKLNDIDDELNSDGHEWKADDERSEDSSQGFSGDSSDSDRTVDEKRGDRKYNFKSCRSLDALPSFESLDTVKDDCSIRTKRRSPRRGGNQFSAENLSEDSGYSDHLCFMKTKSKSNPNVNERKAEDFSFLASETRHRRIAAAAAPEIASAGAGAARGGALRRSAVSALCLTAAPRPPQPTRAASVPADLDLCAGVDADAPRLDPSRAYVQAFRVHESFTTSVADLTALDYRSHSRKIMTSRQDARFGVRIPLRESSAESDSTTESEKAFLKDMERTLRDLDEKTADMLEEETNPSPKPAVLLNNKRVSNSHTAFDAVIAELQKKQRIDSPPRFEFDFYGEDPDPPDYARRRDISGSTTERSSPDLDRFTNSDLFFTSTPEKECDKVRSAPNLNALGSRRSQVEDRPLGILSGRSQGLSGSGSTTRGVHFCPVVAEVSWREVSCSEDSELADTASVSEHTDSETSSRDASPQTSNSVGVSTCGASERERDKDTAMLPERERAVERERPIAQQPVASPTTTVGRRDESAHVANVAIMETKTTRSRIGGFLSRFANFRFSSRKDPKKVKPPPAAKVDASARADGPDYVFIPLKDPKDGGLAGKPPLPRPRAPAKQEMTPPGVLETDLDTSTTIVLIGQPLQARISPPQPPNKARSLLALAGDQPSDRRPHKSMEYLLDKDNLRVIEPPENDLQKNSDRVLSEHELRVQRSLQKLNVPDWYKNAPASREGFLLRKRLSDAASSPSSTRWPGLNGKTTSLGSLGGVALPPPPPQLSPANTSFGRWSTSRLNSNQTSPCSSTRSSVRGTVSPLCSPSTRSSFSSRTPYLGWRSQERLSGRPRTPHERLAVSLLPQNSNSSKASEEIQTSIKEVTSAIVHYVSALEPNNSDEYRAPSPRGSQKFCWVESSFVGTKPLESPQTPLVPSQASLPPAHPRPPSSLRLELHHRDRQPIDGNASQHSLLNLGLTRPSPGSTTLEDVLDSLLGLPASTGRVPTPQASPRRSHNPYNSLGYRVTRYGDLDTTTDYVRSSEGEGDSRRTSETERSHRRKSSADSSSCSTLPPGMDTADSETQSALLTPTSKSQHHRLKSTQQNSSSRRQSEPVANRRSLSLDRRVSFDVNLTGILDMSESKTSLSDLRESKTSLKSIASINTDNSGEETLVRCRYSKCQSKTTPTDAKRHYKSCHNCNYMYCSRECRRAHWEKHRKVCLHSRASTLCRQILSTAKEDQNSLFHISNMGYKSYLASGRGVVKVFFTSPESAEKFITGGFQNLGEPNYVRWQDLEPNEMGAELYAELVKLCKSYNPETKVILYVAVCIVSEVPTKGAVKWERQLVSRCAKMRLSKKVSSQIDRNQMPIHTGVKCSKADSTTGESTSESGTTEALILTSSAISPSKRHMASTQKIREISFANIQKQLHLRGVSLRRHFPEVYAKLCAYVDGASDKFAPVTIYPRDNLSGKSFMCVIMPDTEPDKFDMLPKDSGSYLKIDVSVDDTSDQMSTPM